ncbi:MAG: hypothetical protein ACKODG_01555 [Betaproteobacteria bacterium]
MALSAPATDTIDSSGFPLCFKTQHGSGQSPVLGLEDARDTFVVQARAMGGHQKEAVVSEGKAGSSWRMVSDEGPGLQGTDLAPFPLGFMSAGMQADFMNRIRQRARAQSIAITSLDTELITDYAFQGSFFKGNGRGYAYAPQLRVRIETASPVTAIRDLVVESLAASPLFAAWRTPVVNTFALYANGRRRPLSTLAASLAPDAEDPFKAWRHSPRPLAGEEHSSAIIERIGQAVVTERPPSADWQPGRVDIPIHGRSTMDGTSTRSLTWSNRAGGTQFALRTDEGTTQRAPSGLGYAFAGVAFCLMTQLLRYVEHHKMSIRALRLVQVSDCEITGGRAQPHALDTHIFVHGDEPDAVMERLVEMAANTCYLHAAFHATLEPSLKLEINGKAL